MPEVHRIINKLLATNTYIYAIDETNCVIIDPGSDHDAIDERIRKLNLQPAAILATHGHFDHIASVVKFQEQYDCKFYVHHKDLKTIKLSNFLMKMFSLEGKIEIPKADVTFEDSKEFDIKNKKIFFFHTPGHTYGSCVINIDDTLFTGDTLFYSEVSSKIPNDSVKMLNESQKSIYDKFGENLMVYPGHGEKGTLKDIKQKIAFSAQ